MCGRYAATNPNLIRRKFPSLFLPDFAQPRYNIAPTQQVLIAKNDGSQKIDAARWGLIPAWAKSIESQKIQPINAKIETLFESRMFAPLAKHRRCIFFATGFYEWRHEGRLKIPMYFHRKDNEAFAFAGIWDRWHDEIDSCAIITGEPNDLVATVHNRMPAMLDPEAALEWIGTGEQDAMRLISLLKPYPASEMAMHAVSPQMNKPSFDSPDAVSPVPQ